MDFILSRWCQLHQQLFAILLLLFRLPPQKNKRKQKNPRSGTFYFGLKSLLFCTMILKLNNNPTTTVLLQFLLQRRQNKTKLLLTNKQNKKKMFKKKPKDNKLNFLFPDESNELLSCFCKNAFSEPLVQAAVKISWKRICCPSASGPFSGGLPRFGGPFLGSSVYIFLFWFRLFFPLKNSLYAAVASHQVTTLQQ